MNGGVAVVAVLVAGSMASCTKASTVACIEDIDGCGITIGSGLETLSCACVEFLDEALSFEYFLFCAIQQYPPPCCPCFDTALAALSDSRELRCADQSDLERLKRFIRRATRLGKKLQKRCPNGVNDDCAPPGLVKKINRMTQAISLCSAKIEADCDESEEMDV